MNIMALTKRPASRPKAVAKKLVKKVGKRK